MLMGSTGAKAVHKNGDEIDDEERTLMQRALDENSVIIAQMTPFFDDPKGGPKP